MEFDAGFLEQFLEDLADFCSHNAFHGGLFHADDGDFVLFREGIADFHTNEGGANDDNLLVLLANSLEDVLDIRHEAKQEDVTQFLESGQRKAARRASRREKKLTVRDRFTRRGRDGLLVEVDTGSFVEDEIDRSRIVPFLRTPFELLRVRDERLGQLGTVDGIVGFLGNDGDGALEVDFSQGLNGS